MNCGEVHWFCLELFLLSFCRLWPIDKGFTTSRSVPSFLCSGRPCRLTDTSIVPIVGIWASRAYQVLEKLKSSSSQRSSLIRSSPSRCAPRIWSLVALFCFSWRDGPVPPFPLPYWNALYSASSWILSRESAYVASSNDMFILSLFTQLAWISSAWFIFDALSNCAKDVIPTFVLPLDPALEILPLLAFCDKAF